MKDVTSKTVDEYIQAAPEESQAIMQELKELIESTVPAVEGGISWNVPTYKYHGILTGFDVATKHVSFGIDCLKEEDRTVLAKKGYKTGKRTIQIKFDQEVPVAEIQDLIQRQSQLNKEMI